MSNHLPPEESVWLRIGEGICMVVAAAALTWLFTDPVVTCGHTAGSLPANTAIHQLTAALQSYYAEYGKWPDFTGDGLFLDEARNGQLLNALRSLDVSANPRRIPFIEVRTAGQTDEAKPQYRRGLHPENGSYLDLWGAPYRIALDTDDDGQIASPYPDDPPIAASVIVWSLGKDCKQGAPGNPRTAKGSDDIRSWP